MSGTNWSAVSALMSHVRLVQWPNQSVFIRHRCAISLLSRTGDGSLSSAGLPPFKDGGVVYREVFGLCGTASATSLKSINKIL
jgi:hypothetical protein